MNNVHDRALGEFMRDSNTRAGGATRDKTPYTSAVYDSLPPNSRIFNQRVTAVNAALPPAGAIQNNVEIGTVIVPQGYVFILKQFNVDLISMTGVIGVPNIGATFSIATTTEVNIFTQNIFIDPLTGDLETWLIANQGDTVTITATYDYSTLPGAVAPFQATFQPWFKGHMIPVGNVPSQLVYLQRSR
jgi:hypothetical protein